MSLSPDQTGPAPDPLDARWVLEVDGRIYGPYTGHALREYAREGRVAVHSTVARTGQPAGEEEWMPAGDDPVLATLFDDMAGHQNDPRPHAQPHSRNEHNPCPGSPASNVAPDGRSYGPSKNQVERRKRPGSFNIIIITDVKSRSSGPLETAIMSLGPAYKISANAWVVHSPSGAPEVVNTLTQHLGSADRIFVVDATRNRTAWFNMGPETDSKIRQVWKHQGDH